MKEKHIISDRNKPNGIFIWLKKASSLLNLLFSFLSKTPKYNNRNPSYISTAAENQVTNNINTVKPNLELFFCD